MESRQLGTTGLRISRLGFGAFKIGRNEQVKYAQSYEIPDEDTVHRLLHDVLDLGITHIDTAPAYGLSEERIGRHLAHRRMEFILSTKVGEYFEHGVSRYDFGEQSVRDSVFLSLSRLRTNVLDIVLVHCPANDVDVLMRTPVVTTLQGLKQAGHIRAIGLSGKTVAAARLALAWADVLMVEYSIANPSHADLICEAASRGVGVLVKKGLASGQLPVTDAIPFVLHNPAVTSLVVGGLSRDHLAENIRLANLST